MSATAIDIATIIERSKPREPQQCHTIDHRGYAICGAFRRRADEEGSRTSGLHSRSECKARGHRHCVACDELQRQLGDDFMVG